MSRRSQQALALAVGLTLPWVVLWLGSSVLPLLGLEPLVSLEELPSLAVVGVSGLSVLGAAFLLAWAAETAEKDVPTAFAIAVLAVLAVAPEYAVDALYAWEAGALAGTPEGVEAGNLAVANMTGANRILIGVGWAGIALFTVYRSGADEDEAVERRSGPLADVITIDRDIGLEIVFLLAATAWAFLVPLGGGIDALDLLVLVGLYAAYIAIVLRGPVDPTEAHVGVPSYLQSFSRPRRVTAVIALFAYSGLMIFTAVEPFAHGLEQVGLENGVPKFFMIQWVAPLASESPELIVVLYLVNKARSTAGFNALISSKLNQWTLLIGTLVVVYSIALGQYGVLSFDQKQTAEIWITAAQSLFAIAILMNFEISVREALALLLLFLSQVILEFLIIREVFTLPTAEGAALPLATSSEVLLMAFTAVYIVASVGLLISRRRALGELLRRTRGTVTTALFDGDAAARSGDD